MSITRLPSIPYDFSPLTDVAFPSTASVSIPLANYAEAIRIGVGVAIDWRQRFERIPNTNTLWLLSLEFVGRLLSTFDTSGDSNWLRLAEQYIESFLDFRRDPRNRHYVDSVPSADHATSVRVMVLVKYLSTARSSSLPTSSIAEAEILVELRRCLEWIATPENYHESNHGLMGNLSLLVASQCFAQGTPLRKKYQDLALSRTLALARSAFDSDGMCNENTIGYHRFNVELYQKFKRFLADHQIGTSAVDELNAIIDKAQVALQWSIRPDGSIPPIGDSPKYETGLSSIDKPKCFQESGFAVAKNSETYLSLVCGSRSEVHKQMDDSSFTLWHKGVDIIIDAGSYTYDRSDPYRRYVESGSSHSGVYPVSFDQLLRSEVRRRYGAVQGRIDSFEETSFGVSMECHYWTDSGGVEARRRIGLTWPTDLIIHDTIVTKAELADEKKVLRLPIGPEVEVTRHHDDTFLLTTSKFAARLTVVGADTTQCYFGETYPVVRGWHSIRNNTLTPNYMIECTSNLRTAHFTTVLVIDPKESAFSTPFDTMPSNRETHLSGGDEAITVHAERHGGAVIARTIANPQHFRGDVEYAFYLIIDGQKSAVRWYGPAPSATMPIPAGSEPERIQVQAFVRESSTKANKVIRRVALAP